MARILYYSVHEVLEYDEVRLLQDVNHVVFSLGVYCPVGGRANPFRPDVKPDDELVQLSKIFIETGCRAVFNDRQETILTKEFVDHFDIIIVMHDIHFIAKNWDLFRAKNIVWRTIGQAISSYEVLARPYRAEGLSIVRWSPREIMAEGYIGHDAIIRGYKDSSLYNNWSGMLSDKFLTFCSNYEGRYPAELKFLLEAMAGSDLLIGGGSNQHIDQSIGLVTLEEQVNLLQTCFGYVYFHGSEVPYTLNFIEAWMTGIPVFVIDRSDNSLGQDLIFNEVNDITMNGINAFKVKSPQQACEIIRSMLSQRSVYAEVGRAGRLAAIAMFGKERAQDDWRHFLNRLLALKPR